MVVVIVNQHFLLLLLLITILAIRERTVASPHTKIYGREVGGVVNYVLATPT